MSWFLLLLKVLCFLFFGETWTYSLSMPMNAYIYHQTLPRLVLYGPPHTLELELAIYGVTSESRSFSSKIKMASHMWQVLNIVFSYIFLCSPTHLLFMKLGERIGYLGSLGGGGKLFKCIFFLSSLCTCTLFPPAFFQFLFLVKMNSITCFSKRSLYSFH